MMLPMSSKRCHVNWAGRSIGIVRSSGGVDEADEQPSAGAEASAAKPTSPPAGRLTITIWRRR